MTGDIIAGSQAKIHSLEHPRNTWLNGRLGLVEEVQEDGFVVFTLKELHPHRGSLPEAEPQRIRLHSRNLEPFAGPQTELAMEGDLEIHQGCKARITGLVKHSGFNGVECIVDKWHMDKERWIVRLQGSPDKRVLVRERNLQLVDGLKNEDKVASEVLKPQFWKDAVPDPSDPRSLIGRYVKRTFSGTPVYGKILRWYGPRLGFFIRYEDGESEHCSVSAVRRIIIRSQTPDISLQDRRLADRKIGEYPSRWVRSIKRVLQTRKRYIVPDCKESLWDSCAWADSVSSPVTIPDVLVTNIHSKRYLHDLVSIDNYLQQQVELKDKPLEEIADRECCMDPYTLKAALLRCGMMRDALVAVLSGSVPTAFVLARPACHHVPYRLSLGFCFVNAVAYAIKVAQAAAVHEGRRIKFAILDVDVHHGNGNESAFYRDADVLHMSIHRWGKSRDGGIIMPGTGAHTDLGRQASGARGMNLNFEMREGDGDREYTDVVTQITRPVLEQWKPDILLLLCGFDALDHSQSQFKFQGPGMDCRLSPDW
ncbi:hypothetical protein Pmar_PMAR026730 [Perkinsus marinus ATCC 50983]|uniref:histone deacetylase n=1 Tax=Perkinsus marinus (strain ATCC 50983 / TXsc) TaxID=423536 RepID=C5K5U4_PERM5|nr:hypothetical protein Pmar_PMAR026730 [Perkinsus marinus ATCC 50983]EER20140.1 hypothetical protein Pmar_PMAR026730 [Perkinsus marinus ATCC 50983]|eukprot:XP_002788344.1 hypothetical protein Pmar_PMAR026730 [Perkinsus marinus ATCC 50983]